MDYDGRTGQVTISNDELVQREPNPGLSISEASSEEAPINEAEWLILLRAFGIEASRNRALRLDERPISGLYFNRYKLEDVYFTVTENCQATFEDGLWEAVPDEVVYLSSQRHRNLRPIPGNEGRALVSMIDSLGA